MVSRLMRTLAAIKWLAILITMAAAVGSASALFLWSLDAVTRVRFDNPWLIWLLPVSGLLVGWLYHHLGGPASGGNNLLMDEIHQPAVGVPRRMAPLILVGTLATHLTGGSAGREGTALQMGGSIAAAFARMLRLDAAAVRLVLMAGVAAGFGSVFGTPVAGAIFALEVLVVGRMQYDALVPCFIASVVADWTCSAWGVGHTHYHVDVVSTASSASMALFSKVVFAAVLFGLAGSLFALCSHRLSALFARHVPRPWLRPVIGGMLVIGLLFVAGTPDYLGLGILADRPGAVTLPSMFGSSPVPPDAWLWKLLFTVVTLASGFKGGEVTPLFFIGAALGNTLGWMLGAPLDLFAALGFVAIFAAATNTPVASTLLGMELFGAGNGIFIAAACIVAYRFSGQSGIYSAQRPGVPKSRLCPQGSLRISADDAKSAETGGNLQ